MNQKIKIVNFPKLDYLKNTYFLTFIKHNNGIKQIYEKLC